MDSPSALLPSNPDKIARLHARMVGHSFSESSHSIQHFSDFSNEQSKFSTKTTPEQQPSSFSDSDEEGAEHFSIQPNLGVKKRKLEADADQEDDVQEIAAIDFTRTRKTSAGQSSQAPIHTSDPHVVDVACQTEDFFKAAELEWREEKLKLERELAEERSRNAAEVLQLRHENAKQEKEIQKMRGREQKSMRVFAEILSEAGKRERSEAKSNHRQNAVRLGHVKVDRTGTVLRETWEEGQVYGDIQVKLNAVMQRRQNLEQLRKQNRNISTKDSSTITASNTENEILNARIAAIRQEESELLDELHRYEAAKTLHLRELKRLMSEDASRFNKFQILHQRYALLNLLGKGGFSEVFKAFDMAELRWVACKLHALGSHWSEERKRNFVKHAMREYDIHRQLAHPNIVALTDTFEVDDNTFCTVLEYCQGKDLDALLKANPVLPEPQARSIAVQIMAGLVHLNRPDQPNVIHYDLKPANILFDSLGQVKITDFGLSKVLEEDAGSSGMELTSQGAGTYWYLPPECFLTREKPKVSSKVDVWSLGVIVFQMLFGRKPFGDNQSQEAVLMNDTIVKARQVTFPSQPSISNEAKTFIQRCLTYDQATRPTVMALAGDPFLVYS